MPALPVTLLPAALGDLDDVYDYIAADNPVTAGVYLHQIYQALENLSRFPGIGPEREDIRPGIRGLAFRRHVIFYRVLSERIEILRILHGARDASLMLR